MAVSAVVTIIGLGGIVGADDQESQTLRHVWADYSVHWRRDETPVRGVPTAPAPSVQPEVSQTNTESAPESELHTLSGSEGVICAYFWDDCAHALRVFTCESGDDYIDGNPYDYYVGAAQVDVDLHGWRFVSDPYDLGENMRVARQLYDERGWAPWPVCRYA